MKTSTQKARITRSSRTRAFATATAAPSQLQLGVPSSDGTRYSYACLFPRGTTVENLGKTNSLARVNSMPDGTQASVYDYAKRNIDTQMSVDFAEELVHRYNAFERLLSALEIATATVELGTGGGAQSDPKGWPKNEQGVDVEAVAKLCREVVRRKGRE